MKTQISNLRIPSLIIIFSFLVFLSCSDETPALNSSSTDVHVHDGYLVFTNNEQFEKTLSDLGKLSKEELNEWERNLGFVSKRTKINEALSAYEKATVITVDQVKAKYDDFLIFNDNEFVGLAFPLMQRASLLNKEGMVKIKDDLLIFKNDRVITLFGGDISKLDKAEQLNFSDKNSDLVSDESEGILISRIRSSSTIPYQENGRTKAFIDLCFNSYPLSGVGVIGEHAEIKYVTYLLGPSIYTGYHMVNYEVGIQAISQRFGPQAAYGRNLSFEITSGELYYIAPNPSVYAGVVHQFNTASQSGFNYILSIPLFSGQANISNSGSFNAAITISYTYTIDGVVRCNGTNVISNLP